MQKSLAALWEVHSFNSKFAGKRTKKASEMCSEGGRARQLDQPPNCDQVARTGRAVSLGLHWKKGSGVVFTPSLDGADFTVVAPTL